MSTVSTNFLTSLGAGSGVDTKTLAQNLADAEITPRKDAINTKITKTQNQISGYGYIKTALSDLQSAFNKVANASDFSSISTANTQPNAFSATTTSAAKTGSYSIEVTQLAGAQSTASNGFSANNAALNGGSPFTLDLAVNGGAAQSISVATDTPDGVVSAINNANLGVQAQLLQTGSASAPYTIVVTGASGAAQNFSLTASGGQLSFSNNLQTAADAQFKVNGLSINRSSNQVSDLIAGVTLNLNATTTGTARLDLSRDSSSITSNLNGLVTAYNSLETTLKELGNPKSTVKDVGGSLAGNSILMSIRSQVHGFITNLSSTPGNSIQAARDVGLSFDRTGQLTLDSAKLNTALQNNFVDVVQTFTANTDNKSVYSTAPAGLAGDAVVKLDRMLRSTGIVDNLTTGANKKVTDYKAELTKLDTRMTQLLDRYTKQFASMDSIVGSNKTLQTSLKSTFDGMMASYTNK